jgi:hypothetical protein
MGEPVRSAEQELNAMGYVTRAQASRRLGRSRNYVDALIVNQQIRTKKVGNRIWCDGLDVERFAAQMGREPIVDFVTSYGPAGASDDEPEQELTSEERNARHLAELKATFLGPKVR